MSNPNEPSQPDQQPPAPAQASAGGCLTPVMLVIGVFLLLPGVLCVMITSKHEGLAMPAPIGILTIVGLVLIVVALHKWSRP